MRGGQKYKFFNSKTTHECSLKSQNCFFLFIYIDLLKFWGQGRIEDDMRVECNCK